MKRCQALTVFKKLTQKGLQEGTEAWKVAEDTVTEILETKDEENEGQGLVQQFQ